MRIWGTQRAPARRAIVALAACVVSLALAPASSAADEIGWMYDPDAVVEIHLSEVSPEELDALEAEPNEYVKGTFELTVDGVPKGPALAEVGIRLKGGAGSGRPIETGKSGLKIRFDEFVDDQYFFGIKRLTLNNMIQDPSMVRETLTYELFHALDLPASRTGYAFLTLNGEDYGLFLNLETLDEVSLPRWFETTQHLYEADEPKTDLRPGEAGTFEVDEGDDEDLADLEALIAAVNDEEGDWAEGVGPHADLEQMTSHWAVERYVSHWDGYAGVAGEFRPNNYYLHSDAAGRFQMMPWGTDQTWEFGMDFGEPAGGLMFNNCVNDATCKQLYLDGLTGVHCAVPGLALGAHASQLAAMLAPYQAREDVDRRESTAGEIAESVEDVEALAGDLRPEQLAGYLAAEGVLRSGADPCDRPVHLVAMPPPEGTPPAVRAWRLFFGTPRLKGAFVVTPVEIPRPGTVRQWVAARLGGRWVSACSNSRVMTQAGAAAIRCRLPARAREALEIGALRLRVRLGFDARYAWRVLTAPKRA